ncbi:MAG TPA: hypothetical protein VN661_00790 [Candidatus Acidoferrales bacterium]|nr:hypothetical protein [Candidatus Acidoferrales bacterium]
MKLKQKLSLFSGLLLPSLALSAYFLMGPARVAAANNCPDGDFYAPCVNGGCNNGEGTCFRNGSDSWGYVFCSDDEGRSGGPGQCTDGCVSCDYGPY